MSTFLAMIAERVLNQPLMILPEKLAVIAEVLEGRIKIDASELKERLEGDYLSTEQSRYAGEFRPVSGDSKRLKSYRQTDGGTALIPVTGSLVNRGGFLDAMSGVTSYEKLKHQAAAVANDSEISTVLLDIDSGGGEALGAFEAADAFHQLSLVKPVYAVANGLCCSAAYAIASGASRIISSRSSLTGSIGTAMLHLDRSKQIADMGIKPTLFVTGKRKGDGSPFFELSDEVKGELRSYINRVNQNFLDTVSKHRGVSQEKLLALEAGVFIGAEGMSHGLVDEVGTFESSLAELHGRQTRTPKRQNMDRTFTQAELDTATATAKTEGHKAGVVEGEAAGIKKGTTAERARFQTVMASEAYKGRETSAAHLLHTTEMSAEQIAPVLAGLSIAPAAPEAKKDLPTGDRSKDAQNGLVIEGAQATKDPKADAPKSEFDIGKQIAAGLPKGLQAVR